MYRSDVYFIAKNLVEAPIFTVYAIMYTIIFYILVGFSSDWDRILTCLGTAVLLTWCAISFGKIRRAQCLGTSGNKGTTTVTAKKLNCEKNVI